MPIKNQMRSIMTQLGHDSSRIKEIYKVTDFDRILRKHCSDLNLDHYKKEYSTENWVKLLLWSQVQGFNKIRPFAEQLAENKHWQLICGLHHGTPVQSQISRRLEDEKLHDLLDRTFLTLQHLIPRKTKYYEFVPEKWQLEVLQQHYRPFLIDCTAIELSPIRYEYPEVGYVAGAKDTRPSARLNVMMDGTTGIVVNYQTARGNQHESPLTDDLVNDLTPLQSWLHDFTHGTELTPLLIFDRGYWKKERFIDFTKRGWGWITPWKTRTLTGVQYEMLEFPVLRSTPLEILVWCPGCNTPWRRIIGKIDASFPHSWDVLTNDNHLEALTVLILQQKRWMIEEFFSWLKKQTCFKQPLGTTWASFVTHCFLLILLYIILIYFLLLCEFGRWQDHLTQLIRDIRYSDAECWSSKYLIPSWQLSRGR